MEEQLLSQIAGALETMNDHLESIADNVGDIRSHLRIESGLQEQLESIQRAVDSLPAEIDAALSQTIGSRK